MLDPGRRVLWLDTDGVPGPESRTADNTCNATEAALAERIVEVLTESGISLASIGVISPYRSQARPAAPTAIHLVLSHSPPNLGISFAKP